MFCDPISLPDQWENLSPGTGRLFLFCNRSKGHVPGLLPRIYPSIVSLPFSNVKEICVCSFAVNKKHKSAVWCTAHLLHSLQAGP